LVKNCFCSLDYLQQTTVTKNQSLFKIMMMFCSEEYYDIYLKLLNIIFDNPICY
jgi:hypothetical protein